jgi:(p)ppGpp synthase/HD superfamily hydrolase
MNIKHAIQIAVKAHAGQRDKAGQPYILHPLRMMFAVEAEEERIVAVLHDVVEDCAGWTFERLKNHGFSHAVLEAMNSVTKKPDEDYMTFVRRAGANPIGRQVKIADLRDNIDLSRIADPSARDHARIAKYMEALNYLTTS